MVCCSPAQGGVTMERGREHQPMMLAEESIFFCKAIAS
jgi:hypothetical protein